MYDKTNDVKVEMVIIETLLSSVIYYDKSFPTVYYI